MKRLSSLYLLTFLVAFCSILYELLLGQALSAFMGDTVLRFSVTIGLYLFAMGIGALLAGERFKSRVVLALLILELLLATTGGGCIVLLHLFNAAGMPSLIFSTLAHSLIVIIGLLTGAELPLLIQLQKLGAEKYRTRPDEKKIIGINYIGALVGTLSFAFFVYPSIGIFAGALFIGLVNALAGLLLYQAQALLREEDKSKFRLAYRIQGAVAALLLIALYNAPALSEHFLSLYLSAGS